VTWSGAYGRRRDLDAQVAAIRVQRDEQALEALLATLRECLPAGAVLPVDLAGSILTTPLPGA
jgi:hypothetical protein